MVGLEKGLEGKIGNKIRTRMVTDDKKESKPRDSAGISGITAIDE